MFKLVGRLSNNLSERRYIKEAGNLEIKKIDNSDGQNNLPVTIDEARVLRELEQLEVNMRHNNLRVFIRNIVPCRLKQFFLYTVPALIVAGGVTLFVLPSTYTTTDNLEVFKKEEVVFLNGEQSILEDDSKYYGVYIDRNYVDDNNKNIHPLEGTDLEFYVTEGLEGFRIKASVDNDGKISISEAIKGDYVDLEKHEQEAFSEMDSKYVELFDKVVDMVIEDSYFGKKDDQRLKELSDSDKAYIVGSLVSYYSQGYEDVEVVKNNWWARIGAIVALALYDWLIIYLKNNQFVFESRKVSEKNGELDDTSETYELGFINLGLKYKEAFIDAEEKRIKRIYKLLEENFVPGTTDRVLTSYEKRLILK